MLKQRIITAIILAPLVLAGIIYLSPQNFAFATALVIALGAWEWAELAALSFIQKLIYVLVLLCGCYGVAIADSEIQTLVLYWALFVWIVMLVWVIGYPDSGRYWGGSLQRAFLGLAILIPAWLSLTLLKLQDTNGASILLIMLIIWGADVGAYFSGRAWGNRKLAPKVSPGKTWAGVYGGVALALVVCWLFSSIIGFMRFGQVNHWLVFGLVAIITATVSILGDLTVSMMKRHRGVKDSGKLLPGHGGVMDRIDSVVAGLPIFTLLMNNLGSG